MKQAQDDHDAQRKAMLKAMQEENLLLAKQKRNQDEKFRKDWNYQENHEVNYTLTHDFMTENPATM